MGLVLFLPIIFHLFEGRGKNDHFVKACQDGLDHIPDGAMSLLNEYIAKVFKNDTIANIFITKYSSLNTTAIQLLVASNKCGKVRALETLPLLRELKASSEKEYKWILGWAEAHFEEL